MLDFKVVERSYFFFIKISFASNLLAKSSIFLKFIQFIAKIVKYLEDKTNIPSVTFSKIQDLSFQYLAIICPAYATDGLVGLTVKQD